MYGHCSLGVVFLVYNLYKFSSKKCLYWNKILKIFLTTHSIIQNERKVSKVKWDFESDNYPTVTSFKSEWKYVVLYVCSILRYIHD